MITLRRNYILIDNRDYDERSRGWTHTQKERAQSSGHHYERWELFGALKEERFIVCFRQEPVLYIAGRPHVLRLVDKPLENVE